MNDARVLGAMLRLARRRDAATDDEIALRVGVPRSQVRVSMRRLASAGLIEHRTGYPSRLTMEGLAQAIALLPRRGSRSEPSVVRSSHAA